MGTLIIGLGHKARRGKDTAARAIIEARGHQFDVRKYAFADALKQEVNSEAEKAGGMFALFQKLIREGAPLPDGRPLLLPDWVQYDPKLDMTDPLSPLGKQRLLLQWWGTDYRRNTCDKFYWVRRLKEKLELDRPQVAVITDLRFQNEFLWVKMNGGYTVRLEREGFTDLYTVTNQSHVSEQELEGAPFDVTIVTPEGDLDGLQRDAVAVFDMIVERQSPMMEVPDETRKADTAEEVVAGCGTA